MKESWEKAVREHHAKKLATKPLFTMTKEDLELWIKAAKDLGVRIVVGPR
jgi:hypothetical protein